MAENRVFRGKTIESFLEAHISHSLRTFHVQWYLLQTLKNIINILLKLLIRLKIL